MSRLSQPRQHRPLPFALRAGVFVGLLQRILLSLAYSFCKQAGQVAESNLSLRLENNKDSRLSLTRCNVAITTMGVASELSQHADVKIKLGQIE